MPPANDDFNEDTQVFETTETLSDKTVILSTDDFKHTQNRAKKLTAEYIKRRDTENNNKTSHGTSFFSLSKTSSISQLFEKRVDIDEHIKKNVNSSTKIFNSKEKIENVDIRESLFNNVNDNFDIVAKLAEGGQGTISSAIDKNLGRVIAIKSLHKDLNTETRARENFITEAKITAQLDHPGVVAVYSLNNDLDNGLHLAMKLINGQNLSNYLNDICKNYAEHGIKKFNEKKSIRNRLEIIIRSCDAIAYAHNRNVMHCDLKPENIMIGEYGETYVMDWGIAKLIKKIDGQEKQDSDRKIAGTPYYFAPELLNEKNIDERADIYTMGLILFECVYLKRAFSGKDDREILQNVKDYNIASFTHRYNIPVSRELTAIIQKGVAYEPEDRYQSIQELHEDLRCYLDNEETTALPDSTVSKCARFFSKHVKLLLFLTMFGVFLGIFASLYTVYRHVLISRIQIKEEFILSQAYSKALEASSLINLQMAYIENNLRLIGEEVGLLFDYFPKEKFATMEKNFFNGSIYSDKEAELMGLIPSATHNIPIHLEKISVNNLRDITDSNIENRLLILQILIPKLFDIMANSDLSRNNSSLTLQDKKDNITQNGTSLIWLNCGFEDELFVVYPGYNKKLSSFYPTLRKWYIKAKEAKKTTWGVPYIDAGTNNITLSCSSPIWDNGKLIGVVAADMSMNNMVRLMRKNGNLRHIAHDKMLVNENGEILLDTKKDYDLIQTSNSIIYDEIENKTLFAQVKRRKNGSMRVEENDREYVYIFNYIPRLKWYYVEKIDFDSLMSSSEDDFK